MKPAKTAPVSVLSNRAPRALLGLMLLLLLASIPHSALAALPVAARIAYAQSLWMVEGDDQQLITSITLQDVAPGAALFVAVPGAPVVTLDAASADLLDRLASATSQDAESTTDAPLIAVTEVLTLAPTDRSGLQTWLTQHALTLAPAEVDLLATYSATNWHIVAVRLDAAISQGRTVPLHLSYTAEQRTYPLRLMSGTDASFALDLYVLGLHRFQADPAHTLFADQVDQLAPALADQLASFTRSPGYLTHLHLAQSTSTDVDLQLTQAADDTPLRADDDLASSARILLWLALVASTSFLGTPDRFLLQTPLRCPESRSAPPIAY